MGLFLMVVTQLDDDDSMFMLNLYKNYYGLAKKTIYNMIDGKNDVEDLINDVFIKLIEKISLLRTFERCKLTSYIVYTIRSIAINLFKT